MEMDNMGLEKIIKEFIFRNRESWKTKNRELRFWAFEGILLQFYDEMYEWNILLR